MMMKLEYQKENGEYTILEGKFVKWHRNMNGEDYITMMCWDERENYRRIKPERIVSMSRSFVNME